MQLGFPEDTQLEINHQLFTKKRFFKPYLFRRHNNRPDPTKLREAVEEYWKQIQELRIQNEIKEALKEYLKDEPEPSTYTVVKTKDAVKAAAEKILTLTFKNRKRRALSRVKILPVTKIPRTIHLVTNNIMKVRTYSEAFAKDEGKKWDDQNITIRNVGSCLDRANNRISELCSNLQKKMKFSKTDNTHNDKKQTLKKYNASLSSDKSDSTLTFSHKIDKPDRSDCFADSANVKTSNNDKEQTLNKCNTFLSLDKSDSTSTPCHKIDKPDQSNCFANLANVKTSNNGNEQTLTKCNAFLSSHKSDSTLTFYHKIDKPDQNNCSADLDNVKTSSKNKEQTLSKCNASLSSDKSDSTSTSGHKINKPDQRDCFADSANVKTLNNGKEQALNKCNAFLSSDKSDSTLTYGYKIDKHNQNNCSANSVNVKTLNNGKEQKLNKCNAILSLDKSDSTSTSGHKIDKPYQSDCSADSVNVKTSNVSFHSIYSNVPLEGLNPRDPRINVRLKHDRLNKTGKSKSTNLDKPESTIYSKIPLWGLHPNDPRVEKRFEGLDLMRMTSKETLKRCCAVKHEIDLDVEEIKDHDDKFKRSASNCKRKHEKTNNLHFRLDNNLRSPITKYNQVYLHVHKHIFTVADQSGDSVADNLKEKPQSKLKGFAVSGDNNSEVPSKALTHSNNKSELSTANTTTTDINSNLERGIINQDNRKDMVSKTEDEITCSSSSIIQQEVQHKKPLIYDKSIGKRFRCGRGKNSRKWQALRRRLIKKYSEKL